MSFTKKIAQFLALIFLALPLFSCKEGCVAADEFDSQSITIESLPDQIYGSYDPINGGQRVDWKNTELRVNGLPLLMQISGSWSSLQGGSSGSQGILDRLPRCNICTKRDPADNCICRWDQEPEPELAPSGNPYTLDADGNTLNCASNADHQDDALRCTCTKQHGKATDYGLYHFPRDLLNKDETVKLPDQQNNCKYDRGLGAYMSLWGSNGVTTPLRAYHLYSEESVCNITLNSDGECIDSQGRDRTRWIFRSANRLPFMKDDNSGNTDIDLNTVDDVYHSANEQLKTIMYDQYYRDNYGSYNVQIFGGVGKSKFSGILESLVGLVEDSILGKVGDDGKREGGILRSMYQSIVTDSGFAQILQISLALYIAIFGAAHIWGLAEMNKKEIFGRVIKIGLIMLFVSPTSWEFYNTFIVGFFKDGLDYLVGIFMTLTDSNIEQTSMIKVSQMDRVTDSSSATRFAYVDLIIRNLMSEAVSKKIISLFFTNFFGWFYIIAIYLLIFFFISVMLYVALIYVVNYLMKIVFVMSIGPIFIIFSLFKKTSGYFRNWLSYIAARSFEMLVLFIVLYLFVTIIDKNFNEMLLYNACAEPWGLGPLKMMVLKSDVDRGLAQWLLYFVTIFGLIFIMLQVIEQVPRLSGSLFTINIGDEKADGGYGYGGADFYTDNKGYASKSIAGSIAADFKPVQDFALATSTSLFGRVGSGVFYGGLRAINALGDITGFNSVYKSTTYRGGIAGNFMDDKFKAALEKNSGNEDGARDAFNSEMRDLLKTDPLKMAAVGINERSISEFLDEKLIRDPLRNFLKEETKRMKKMPADQIPIGEADVSDYLKRKADEWTKKNLSQSSAKRASEIMREKGIRELMRNQGTLNAKEAKEAFAGNKALEDKFRADLANRQFAEKQKGDNAWKNPVSVGLKRLLKNAYRRSVGDPFHNPGMVLKSFEKGRLDSDTGNLGAMRSYLRESGAPIDTTGMNASSRRAAERQNERNQFFKDQLRKSASEYAGSHPDHAKRAELLGVFGRDDGRTIFEKAVALDQLNKHNGFGGESAQTRLAKMMDNRANLLAREAKKGDKKAEQDLKRMAKDGMYATRLDRETLDAFMAKELAKRQGQEVIEKENQKEIDAELERRQQSVREKLAEISSFRADPEKGAMSEKAELDEIFARSQKESADARNEEERRQSLTNSAEELVAKIPSIIPEGTSLQDIFGAGASGVLIPGGNVMLGADGQPLVDAPKEAQINLLKLNNNQLYAQVQLTRLNLQVKQIDLEQAKSSGDAEKIRELEGQVAKLENDLQDRRGDYDKGMNDLKELSK
ncbi:MAG: type IV secretion system protein [Proteobacteria bacterium]|nr:type IV secretion system protein [Pseudomonadota bacterium]